MTRTKEQALEGEPEGTLVDMRLLVIHKNFPGQFAHAVRAWVRQGWDVLGLGRESAPGITGFERLLRYRTAREPRRSQHLRQMESATLNGQAVARVLLVLKQRGYLTYPFVLSWPLLEAMACRAKVVAADVAPVRGVARDGVQAHLVDGLDPTAVASRLLDALDGATTSLAWQGEGESRIPTLADVRRDYERVLQGRLGVVA